MPRLYPSGYYQPGLAHVERVVADPELVALLTGAGPHPPFELERPAGWIDAAEPLTDTSDAEAWAAGIRDELSRASIEPTPEPSPVAGVIGSPDDAGAEGSGNG